MPTSTFIVPVDVYDTRVRVFRDLGAMYRFAQREGASAAFLDGFDSPCEGRAFNLRTPSGRMVYGVYLGEDPPAPGTVAHECFHLARFILGDHGVKDRGPREATAYLLGYLVNAIYARIGREARSASPA